MRAIDADKFEVYAYTTPSEYDEESYDAGVKKVIDDIDAAPTIEAEPVRHGKMHVEVEPFYDCRREHFFCPYCHIKIGDKTWDEKCQIGQWTVLQSD